MTYDLLKPVTVEALVNAVTKDGAVREDMNLLEKLPSFYLMVDDFFNSRNLTIDELLNVRQFFGVRDDGSDVYILIREKSNEIMATFNFDESEALKYLHEEFKKIMKNHHQNCIIDLMRKSIARKENCKFKLFDAWESGKTNDIEGRNYIENSFNKGDGLYMIFTNENNKSIIKFIPKDKYCEYTDVICDDFIDSVIDAI